MKGTVILKNAPSIIGIGSVVGKSEWEGPLSGFFDEGIPDGRFGEKTWEQAESKFQKTALGYALGRAGIKEDDLSAVFSGDLLNQCTASSFSYRDNNVPFVGLYGACSTFVEGLSLAAMLVDSGLFGSPAAVCASSHFCTAERQYRNPLEYGGQRPQSAQRTVTGAGAVVIGKGAKDAPVATSVTIGSVVDSGISDANNMGATMAPAALSTLMKHFENTNTSPEDYDLIATGDLGEVGRKILVHLCSLEGVELGSNYIDCGCKMFDIEAQDMHSGASGAACSATVFAGYICKEMMKGTFRRVLFAGTGSLQSPLTVQQKETIPGVCHAICFERGA